MDRAVKTSGLIAVCWLLAAATTLLLAEMFKVTGGKLREIRAVILNLPNGAGTGWTAR